jgi:signal transduction histidine kinase
MAWAALCDAYFGIYCLMIAGLYVATTVVRVTRSAAASPRGPWVWLLDVLIVCIGGLVAGLALGRGGDFEVLGVAVRMRSLYTPVLILTVLVTARAIVWWRPRLMRMPDLGPLPVKAILVAGLACIGPLSPVLYGTVERIADGRFVSPRIFWRSSPRGVDLLAFFTPNPNHPVVRALFGDALAVSPTQFVEYTASLSLVAIAVIALAIWRAKFRPRAGWLWITIGFALLALGPFVYVAGVNTHIPGPWALLRYVTPIGLARMPTRFAIVAGLGLVMLMAGALAAMGAQWPQRRRAIVAVVAALLAFELFPAPRPLYSAAISSVFDTIAADPRDVRVLSLPFGVRDGVSSTGNFRPRSQFNQTRHEKRLIGGYLSRISPRRVERIRSENPTLAVLMKMSERQPLSDQDRSTVIERGARFVDRTRLGYVVIDRRFIPEESARLVIEAWDLEEVQRDQHLTLYKPAAP